MPLGPAKFFQGVYPFNYQVHIVAVGGGGGGARGHGAGGGGGGGVYDTWGTDGSSSTHGISNLPLPTLVKGTTYDITIGAGGSGTASSATSLANGANGGQTEIDGDNFDRIFCLGGQGGLYSNSSFDPAPSTGPTTGGSGGRAYRVISSSDTAQFPSGDPGSGGVAKTSADSTYQNGGGGGSSGGTDGQDGSTGTASNNGDGGAGPIIRIRGYAETVGSGGGGCIFVNGGGDGASGAGSGSKLINPLGAGGRVASNASGIGSGGGGGLNWSGSANSTSTGSGNGGGGLVVFRIPVYQYSGNVTGSPEVTRKGADYVIAWTQDGSYTA